MWSIGNENLSETLWRSQLNLTLITLYLFDVFWPWLNIYEHVQFLFEEIVIPLIKYILDLN